MFKKIIKKILIKLGFVGRWDLLLFKSIIDSDNKELLRLMKKLENKVFKLQQEIMIISGKPIENINNITKFSCQIIEDKKKEY